MNIDERKRLLAKIIADLDYLISQCWSTETRDELQKALDILRENTYLEGYDD